MPEMTEADVLRQLTIPDFEDSVTAVAMTKEVQQAALGYFGLRPGAPIPTRTWPEYASPQNRNEAPRTTLFPNIGITGGVTFPCQDGFLAAYNKLISSGTQLEAIARAANSDPSILQGDRAGLNYEIGGRITDVMEAYPVVVDGLRKCGQIKVGRFLQL